MTGLTKSPGCDIDSGTLVEFGFKANLAFFEIATHTKFTIRIILVIISLFHRTPPNAALYQSVPLKDCLHRTVNDHKWHIPYPLARVPSATLFLLPRTADSPFPVPGIFRCSKTMPENCTSSTVTKENFPVLKWLMTYGFDGPTALVQNLKGLPWHQHLPSSQFFSLA